MGHEARAAEMSWVLIGCGYTGLRLASRLAQVGAAVVACRRSPDALAGLKPGIVCRAADLERAETLAGLIPAGAVVVNLAPPSSAQDVAEQNLVEAAVAANASRLVYVSSTGVYGAAAGAWVEEDEPPAPLGPRGARRLQAESVVLGAAASCGLEVVSLRVAGIYGPERGVVARMRAGTYRILGAGDTFVSRVHVYDLCSAIIAAGVVSPLPSSIYNVADDEPTTSHDYASGVAQALDLAMPLSLAPDQVPVSVAAMIGADRRVSNRRLKRELGVALRYPGWRDSLAREAC